jgi:uncharacterized protein
LPDFAAIEPITLAALIACGLAGGFINTIAASGATVTLPTMISLGLSPGIANGTNRLAAVAGLATATWRFQQAGAIPWKLTLKATLPMVLGASLGALGATALADEWITLAVAISLIFVLIILITKPTQLLQEPAIENENIEPKLGFLFYSLMALTGIWAGFISLGSGVMTLLVLVLARLSSSLIALLIFGLRGDINWLWALPLALSSMVGANVAAKIALGPQANQWIFRSLIVVVCVEAGSFLWRLNPGLLA